MAGITNVLSTSNVVYHLKDMNNKAFELGVQLNIDVSILKTFPTEAERQMIEVIDYWINNSKERSWGLLAIAVDRVGGFDLLKQQLEKLQRSQSAETGILVTIIIIPFINM